MARDLTNYPIIQQYQEENSLASALIFISGINIDASKNFETYLIDAIDNSQTSFLVYGNYGSYTGNIIVNSEIMDVTLAVNSGDNTVIQVTRNNDTVPVSHLANELVYTVQFMDEINTYDYEMRSDVSDSDLFGVNLEVNNIRILAEYLDWSNFSSSRKYEYRKNAPVFILEGINNQFIKTYQGYTTNKNPQALEGYVDIEFKGELDIVYDSDIRKVVTYKDMYIGEILTDYYPEYRTRYVSLLNGEADTYKIGYVNTGSFKKDSEFLKALCRDSACRIRFETDKYIDIFSEVKPESIVPVGVINENLTDINQQGSDLLVFNNLTGTYLEKSSCIDPNNFATDAYIRFLNNETYVGSVTIVEEITTTTVTPTYRFKANLFEGVDITKTTYGDYVLLVSDSGNEWWGKVIDILPDNGGTVQVQFGFDKAQRLNQDGRLTAVIEETGYTLYYEKDELPIVWQYGRNINGNDRVGNLRTPVCPIVIDNALITTSISFTDNNTMVITGADYTQIGKYGKLVGDVDEYVLIEGTDYDGSDTTLYIQRAKLNTVQAISVTSFTPIKYSNMIEVSDSFKFANENEREYSGTIENADTIIRDDLWYDNTELLYNKEYTQTTPIYLYTNTPAQKGLSNTSLTTNNKRINYNGFDNINAEVLFETSKNTEFGFNAKIKNAVELDLSSIEVITPSNVIGTQIEVTDEQYETVKCGDVLALDEVLSGDVKYQTYLNAREQKWLVLGKSRNATTFKYWIECDFNYPLNISGDEFDFLVYANGTNNNVILQELSVRGNPIMQVRQSISERDEPSIKIYGERPFDITNNVLSFDNFKAYVDHIKNNYKGTALNNTKSKVPFSTVCRMDYNVLDVITLSDPLITGFRNQDTLIINKKVSNKEGKRNENYIGITLGEYTANANNIIINSANNYTAYRGANYNHKSNQKPIGDDDTKVAEDSAKLVDGNIVSYTDPQFGQVSLLEIPVASFMAYVSSFDGTIGKTGALVLKDITTGSPQYNRILTTVGLEGFIKIRNELMSYTINTANTLQILTREVFGTQLTEIFVDDEIQFYQVVSKVTSEGLYSTGVVIGDSETFLKFNTTTGLVVSSQNVAINTEGDNNYLIMNGSEGKLGLGTLGGNGEILIGIETSDNYLKYSTGDGFETAGKYFNKTANVKTSLELIGASNSTREKIWYNSIEEDNPFFGKNINNISLTSQDIRGSDIDCILAPSTGIFTSVGHGLVSGNEVVLTGENFILDDNIYLEDRFFIRRIDNDTFKIRKAEYSDTIDVFTTFKTSYTFQKITPAYDLQPLYYRHFADFFVEKTSAPNTGVSVPTPSNGIFLVVGTHDFKDNDRIRFNSSGTFPTGLEAKKTYYVSPINGTTFKIKLTYDGVTIDSFASGGSGLTYYEGNNNLLSFYPDINTVKGLYGSSNTTIYMGEKSSVGNIDDWGIYLGSQVRFGDVRLQNAGSGDVVVDDNASLYMNSKDIVIENLSFNNVKHQIEDGLRGTLVDNQQLALNFNNITINSYYKGIEYIFLNCNNGGDIEIQTDTSGAFPIIFFQECGNINNIRLKSFDITQNYFIKVYGDCWNITNHDSQNVSVTSLAEFTKNMTNFYNVRAKDYVLYGCNNVTNLEWNESGEERDTYYMFQNSDSLTSFKCNLDSGATTPHTKFFEDCNHIVNCTGFTDPTYNTNLTYDINNSWNTDLTNNAEFPNIKVGDVTGGDYFEVNDDGDVRLKGDATSWDDLRVPISATEANGSFPPVDSLFKDDGTFRAGTSGAVSFLSTTAGTMTIPETLTWSSSHTMEFWLRPVIGTQNNADIFDKASSVQLRIRATNRLRLTYDGVGRLDTGIDFNRGSWNHIALSYDGTTISFYLNGVLRDTATGTPTSNANSLVFNTNTTLFDVDYISLWDTALPQTGGFYSIDGRYNSGAGSRLTSPNGISNLIDLWELNETTGNFLNSITGRSSIVANSIGVEGTSWERIGGHVDASTLASQGVLLKYFSPDTRNELYFTAQMPHAWLQGSDLEAHIHVVAPTTETIGNIPRFGLEYVWANIGSDFEETSLIYGGANHLGSTYIKDKHYVVELGSIDATGQTISSMLVCRVFRDGAHVDDTYTDFMGLLEIDFHYQLDSFGSDEEYSKA